MARKKRPSNRQPNRQSSRGSSRANKPSFNQHPFPHHHELEVCIESLSNQGDGVAKVDIPSLQLTSWVIFTPFTIPGETVRIRITRNNKNCSLAELVEVITPSSHRRDPLCPLFTQCGGCQYQHIDYPLQLSEKTSQIKQLLHHIAAIETKVNDAIPSPKEYYYRSKITPHFR